MATSAPVRGLRPIPVLRGRTLKMPKAAQLDSIALGKSLFHRFKHCLDRHFGFRLGYACPINDFVNDV